MKKYDNLKKKLKDSELNKKEILSSNIFNFIKNNLSLDQSNIFFANIKSMCLENSPEKIRIRNDNFLRCASTGKISYLFSGIKINNKKFLLFFSSKSFYNYPFSTKSSNSFINFDFHNFINNIISFESDNIAIVNNKNKTKYIFYVSNDDYFDSEYFLTFWKEINETNFDPYSSSKIKKLTPPIPGNNKKTVRDLYENFCSLVYEKNQYTCPCGSNINIKKIMKYNLNYTDIHHFAPKEFLINIMLEREGILNWNKIHDTINLIPLCSPCHQAIHKGKNNNELVSKVFNSIKNCYILKNRLNDFEKFLNEINLSLNDLYQFYLN